MPTSFIVVDDFLDHAQALREAALRLSYPEQQGSYQGSNSAQRIDLDGLAQEVSRLTGEPLVPLAGPQSHGKLRISLADDPRTADVHVDPSHWSGILYLSKPEDCRGGTEFFRHRQTNTDRAPYSDAEARRHGYPSAKAMVDDVLGRDGRDPSKWEMSMRVPMRFNRLLLLRPWLWHTAGEGFGDSLENGRLVYLMFFASDRA